MNKRRREKGKDKKFVQEKEIKAGQERNRGGHKEIRMVVRSDKEKRRMGKGRTKVGKGRKERKDDAYLFLFYTYLMLKNSEIKFQTL